MNKENQHILLSSSSGISEDKSCVSTWYIDSGASQHISNTNEIMENYTEFINI